MKCNYKISITSIITLALLPALFLSGCKDRDDDDIVNKAVTEETKLTKEQQWSSEIYQAMKSDYLWTDALPETFDPTKYATAEDALEYLIGLKINEKTGKPIDRYSFLDEIGGLSGEISTGLAGDYGFMIAFAYKQNNEISAFVTYVYSQSPAGKAGVTRSCELVGVNGSTDVHPTVNSEGYVESNSAAYRRISDALFNSSTAKFTFKEYDGTTFDVDLTVNSYSVNTVLHSSVITTESSKKVGYMVYNSFLGSTSVSEIKSTISDFASKGVEYLIVDLRYNGGGAVSTCAEFCNQVAPASANNKVMFRYIENEQLMKGEPESSFITRFRKTNSFSPKAIYFIVGGGTASASELLINSLKPYFPNALYLVGSTTYGKPCGFWSVPIGYDPKQYRKKEGYDLYAVSFESVNANGEGGYYDGMTPDIEAKDGLVYKWGETNEPRLSQALFHIENGAFKTSTIKSKSITIKSGLDHQFKGMIDFEHGRNVGK